MAIGSILFLSNEDRIINNVGVPEIDENNFSIFYKLLSTGVESLFPFLSDGMESHLTQVYTDGKFVEGTYEVLCDFTSWTFEFQNEFIQALSNIDVEQTDSLIHLWSDIEDCPYDNQKDLKDLLVALSMLAQRTLNENKRMFFRNEL